MSKKKNSKATKAAKRRATSDIADAQTTTVTAPDPDLVPLSEAMKPATNTKAGSARTASKAKASTKDSADAKPPKKLSCLDAAAQVLKSEGKPMTCKQMIDAMFNAKLWHSDAPTPAATLYSAILREVQKKGSQARFAKTDRGLFTVQG